MSNKNDIGTRNSLRWMVLVTVIVGTLLGRLDSTVVNLALPKIINDFSITVSEAGWIVTAYILANSVFVPIWGKLGDTLGRKKVYLLGFTIFIIGSILAGLAWNLSSMLVFRAIQAVASSADYPTAMAIIAVTFPNPKERTQALGLWSSSFVVASVLGPLIGGPLIDTFGWRSVFYINVPVGLVGMGMALTFVKESVSDKPTQRFDLWGSVTLGGAVAALVLVLDRGSDWGWLSANSLLAYLAVVVFGYLFYRIDRGHPDPIVNFKFFKTEAFDSALANNFLIMMGMNGAILLLPVFVQTFLGYTATETGYLFIPMALAMMVGSPLGASLAGKVRAKYVIAISTLIAGLGLLLFTWLDARSTVFDILLPVLVLAFGMGFGMAQRTSIIAALVPIEEVGIASSILALARNIGGAFGISVFTAILDNAIESSLLAISQNSMLVASNPLLRAQGIVLMELKANIDAYRQVFLLASLVAFLAALVALFTLNIKDEKMEGEKKAEQVESMELAVG